MIASMAVSNKEAAALAKLKGLPEVAPATSLSKLKAVLDV